MANKEECWVIQRDDGRYFTDVYGDWYNNIKIATFYKDKGICERLIGDFYYCKCRPVKVEIKICEEEECDENI